MNLILMYHKIHKPHEGLLFPNFKQHLEKLVERYPIIVPGEQSKQFSVCLTFDDAYFDFYYYVFPLLKQFNIKAVLGVPTNFINDNVMIPSEERLSLEGFNNHAQFCTWQELKEMATSGHVILASHTHTHINLTHPDVDIEDEIITSKNEIIQRTGIKPHIFIYPFGRSNTYCRDIVHQHYEYSMRIGNALNLAWKPLLYRVSARQFCNTGDIFGFMKRKKWLFNYGYNKLRRR